MAAKPMELLSWGTVSKDKDLKLWGRHSHATSWIMCPNLGPNTLVEANN